MSRDGYDAFFGGREEKRANTGVQFVMDPGKEHGGEQDQVEQAEQQDLQNQRNAALHELGLKLGRFLAGFEHHVADAADRLYIRRTLWIVAELLADGRDVDVDGAVEGFEIAFGYFEQELFACFYAALSASQ